MSSSQEIPKTLPGHVLAEKVGRDGKFSAECNIPTDLLEVHFTKSGVEFNISRYRSNCGLRSLSRAQNKLVQAHDLGLLACKGASCVIPESVALTLIDKHANKCVRILDERRDKLVSDIQTLQAELAKFDSEHVKKLKAIKADAKRAKKHVVKQTTIKAYQG